MKIMLVLLICVVFSQYCKDDKGKQVDWWFILKLPRTTTSKPQTYLYYDNQSESLSMKLMTDHLGDDSTPLQQTVHQMLFTSTDTMSVVWNDQHYTLKDHTIGGQAHSKGMLSASTKQGFIINHSTPNFPGFDNSDAVHAQHEMPQTSLNWGQHFLCITMDTTNINKVAEQLVIADVYTQKASVDAARTFASGYKYIALLKDNSRGQEKTAKNAFTTVNSLNREEFRVFSTNEYDEQDFYAKVLAPGLQVGLKIQSWQGKQEADCTEPYHTYSNKNIKHDDYAADIGPYRFTMDHSKYGISDVKEKPYVCVSDLNREVRQNKRGGTAICFKNEKLWTYINSIFKDKDPCEVKEAKKRKVEEMS